MAISSGSNRFGASNLRDGWDGAAATCAGMDAHLLVTNTEQEYNDAVAFMALDNRDPVAYIWLGCRSPSNARYRCGNDTAYYYGPDDSAGYWGELSVIHILIRGHVFRS